MQSILSIMKSTKKYSVHCPEVVGKKLTVQRVCVLAMIVLMTVIACATIAVICKEKEIIVEVDPVLKGTELVFAFIVFRHGDRTPEAWVDLASFGDVDVIRSLVEPWGYGQLTNAGIRTAYKTGEWIRARYSPAAAGLLPARYNASQVRARSTDVTRVKMSALAALAAVFPPAPPVWSDAIPWVPVPYTTLPAKDDFMLAIPGCPTLESKKEELSTPGSIFNNENLTLPPHGILKLYSVYSSLMALGYDLGEEVRALLPNITASAARDLDTLFEDDTMLALETGVLLQEFFTYTDKIISGEDTPRVRIYAGHDMNVYSLEAALGVERQGMPLYGSLLALELRRVVDSGQFVVLPVYLSDPHKGETKYLRARGCGGELCDYGSLYNSCRKFLLDEHTWRLKCNITEDHQVTVS